MSCLPRGSDWMRTTNQSTHTLMRPVTCTSVLRLNADGEYLALVGPQGIVSEFGAAGADYPQQYADISYGYDQQKGGGHVYFLAPTPGAANGLGVEGIVTDQVSFSHVGNTFVEAFDLELSSTSATGTIRFTLDGSVPRRIVDGLHQRDPHQLNHPGTSPRL